MKGVMVNGLLPTSCQGPNVIYPTAIHEGNAVSQPRVNPVASSFRQINSVLNTVSEVLSTFVMDTFGFSSLVANNARVSDEFNIEVIWPHMGSITSRLHSGSRILIPTSSKRPLDLGGNGKTLLGMNMAFEPMKLTHTIPLLRDSRLETPGIAALDLLVSASIIQRDGDDLFRLITVRATNKEASRDDVMSTPRASVIMNKRSNAVLYGLPTQAEFPPRRSFGTHADLGRLDNQGLFFIKEMFQLISIKLLVATEKTLQHMRFSLSVVIHYGSTKTRHRIDDAQALQSGARLATWLKQVTIGRSNVILQDFNGSAKVGEIFLEGTM
jgi:hypothetical protein